jgi:hypothetical protein
LPFRLSFPKGICFSVSWAGSKIRPLRQPTKATKAYMKQAGGPHLNR